MADPSVATIVVAVLLVSGGAAAQPEDETAGRAGTAPDQPTEWRRPDPSGPRLPATPVRARPVRVPPPEAARASPYLSLRAVALAQGEGKVQTGTGVVVLRAGDRLGRDLVSAVDVGMLVLERRAAAGERGGDARVVIRFDAAGKPTVRVYRTEDPTKAEPGSAR